MNWESKEFKSEIEFKASRDGFSFMNDFNGKWHVGLCGGMVLAAMDFKLCNRVIPQTDVTPEPGSELYRYLLERQWDSLEQGKQISRYIEWMAKPEAALKPETIAEMEEVRARLSDGELVPLALIYVTFRETPVVWRNHQVLATGIVEDFIKIYDPNLPGNDNVYLKGDEELWLGEDGKTHGLRVQGAFVMPYQLKVPPRELALV